MKKGLLVTFLGLTAFSNAQLVSDSVTMGAGYANNIWYSLQNDEQGSAQAATNWELGLATSINPSNPLAASIIFNSKIGQLFAVPGTTGSDLLTADTAGISGWTSLYNSDSTWSLGALNQASSGGMDYGWGTYDAVSHSGINANKIFAIKYTNGTCKLFSVSLNFNLGEYTIDFCDADHSNVGNIVIPVASYNTKNFVYYAMGGAANDREPATTTWDLLFTQYAVNNGAPYPFNLVTGVLHNVGVEVAELYPVNDPETDNSFWGATLSENISTIGYDWKTYSGTYTIADSLLYIVKDVDGDYWRLIMTGFSGSSLGKTVFKKEKVSSLSVSENTTIVQGIYPNPAATSASIVIDAKAETVLNVVDMNGTVVYSKSIQGNGLQTQQIDLSTLANGVYQVVIASEANQHTQRLIVQH